MSTAEKIKENTGNRKRVKDTKNTLINSCKLFQDSELTGNTFKFN
jgi:hypothetical protein